jgi:two-component system chemotaxis response regulator CheB
MKQSGRKKKTSGGSGGSSHSRSGNGEVRSGPAGNSDSENTDGHRPEFRVIVIGASAGGVEALSRVVMTLPRDLPAAVFVVLHIPASGPSLLPDILNRAGPLPAHQARDGEKIERGRIYVAPPDHHMLIKPGRVMIARGPRENNARPAVDPLFRTAARSYGPWAVGVILSGGLDDGTLGMMDVKRFGGITIVQNPDEAMFPGMPRSTIQNVHVDRVSSLDDIGPLLTRLAREPVPFEEGAEVMVRNKTAGGPDIAEVGTDDLKTMNMEGPPSRFTCPECGGALWELQNQNLLRYRCHVGHAFTAESLMAAQGQALEDALWTALRALEETAAMRRRMSERAYKGGWDLMGRQYEEQAEYAQSRAGMVRSVLVEDQPRTITAESARKVEGKAAKTKDKDAGRALAHQRKMLRAGDGHSAATQLRPGASRSGGGRRSSPRAAAGTSGKKLSGRVKAD